MKFNKAKLAALAMSVFMAFSSIPAMAEGEVTAQNPAGATSIDPNGTPDIELDQKKLNENPGSVEGYTVYNPSEEEDAEHVMKWYPSADGSTCEVRYWVISPSGQMYHVVGAEASSWEQVTEQTCTTPDARIYHATLFGAVYSSDPATIVKPALGHHVVEDHRYVEVHPWCEDPGSGWIVYKCDRCGEVFEEESIPWNLEPLGHIWPEETVTEYVPVANPHNGNPANILLDEDGNVVLGEDGLPQLKDVTKDAYYLVHEYKICERDPSHILDVDKNWMNKEPKEILAEKGWVAVVVNTKNVEDSWSDYLIGQVYTIEFPGYSPIPLDLNEIELIDCRKPGYLVVEFYSRESYDWGAPANPLSYHEYEIPAHHMLTDPIVEFASLEDAKQCTVTYNEDGSITVVNNSCYKDITYYVVTHCVAEGNGDGCLGCKACEAKQEWIVANGGGQYGGYDHPDYHEIGKEYSREAVVAPHAGPHVYNTAMYELQYLKWAKEYHTYDEVKADCDNPDNWMRITNYKKPTCTEDGAITVEFLCKVCHEPQKTVVIPVKALGHKKGPAVDENVVNPTCTSEGSYDAVIYCANGCGTELSRRHIRIPRLPHTNELDVYQDEFGIDQSAGIDTWYDETAYIVWEGDIVVDFNGTLKMNSDKTQIGINAKDADNDPEQGKDTYTEDYVVTTKVMNKCAICGGNHADTGMKATLKVLEVTKQPTSCQSGIIKLQATYTKHDGTKVVETKDFEYWSSLNAFQNKTAHVKSSAKIENSVEATAETEGSYDENYYCIYCGELLESIHHTVPATGYFWDEGTVTKEATCTEAGEITYKATNGDKSYTEEIPALGHTPAEAVVENEVEANCTEAGSYDEVVYCSVCGEELSRETKTVEAFGHTPAEAVIENEVDATCTEDGSYDVVYYCAECDIELNRETVTVPAKGHVAGSVKIENTKYATCTEDGSFDVVVYCSVCGEEASRETSVIPATGHKPAKDAVIENYVAPTHEAEGGYDVVFYCTVCNEEVSRTKVVLPKNEHVPGEPVKENNVDPTCTKDGSYDVVVYCTEDGDEISRETIVVPATGHTPAEAVIENEVAATCTEEGSYDVVVYCSVCEEELSRETKTVEALGHTPAEAVIENEVAATCTEEGSYDEVVYCAVCGEELSREAKTVAALGHTPAEAVKENEVAATYITKGSYDEVVYCSVCGEELSRETVIVPEVVLPAVQNLKATAIGLYRVNLTWDAVEGADGYIILRDGQQIGHTVGATSYTDKFADSRDWNYYWVIPFAKNAEGKLLKGELSNYVWQIGRVLGAAENLKAEAEEGVITLTWDPVENANGYVILSKTNSNKASFNEPIKSNGEETTFEITDAKEGDVMFYWVYATYTTEAGNTVVAGAVSNFAWVVAE